MAELSVRGVTLGTILRYTSWNDANCVTLSTGKQNRNLSSMTGHCIQKRGTHMTMTEILLVKTQLLSYLTGFFLIQFNMATAKKCTKIYIYINYNYIHVT
jgi:hypothetical protein